MKVSRSKIPIKIPDLVLGFIFLVLVSLLITDLLILPILLIEQKNHTIFLPLFLAMVLGFAGIHWRYEYVNLREQRVKGITFDIFVSLIVLLQKMLKKTLKGLVYFSIFTGVVALIVLLLWLNHQLL